MISRYSMGRTEQKERQVFSQRPSWAKSRSARERTKKEAKKRRARSRVRKRSDVARSSEDTATIYHFAATISSQNFGETGFSSINLSPVSKLIYNPRFDRVDSKQSRIYFTIIFLFNNNTPSFYSNLTSSPFPSHTKFKRIKL